MKELIEVIKQVAVNAVASQKPMELMYGKVTSVSPLEVRVSQSLILDKNFLVVLEGHPDFRVGDRLVLLRMQGGQQFLIMGRRGSI